MTSPSARDALQLELPGFFAGFEHTSALPSLRRLEAGDRPPPEVVQLGVLDPEVRVETFYSALERLVLPRLVRLGFDAQGAWEARYKPV